MATTLNTLRPNLTSLAGSGWDVHVQSDSLNNFPSSDTSTAATGTMNIFIDLPKDQNVQIAGSNYDTTTKIFTVALQIDLTTGTRRIKEYQLTLDMGNPNFIKYIVFTDHNGNKKKAVSSNANLHPFIGANK